MSAGVLLLSTKEGCCGDFEGRLLNSASASGPASNDLLSHTAWFLFFSLLIDTEEMADSTLDTAADRDSIRVTSIAVDKTPEEGEELLSKFASKS